MYKQHKKIGVNPVARSSVQYSPTDELKYFFEPVASSKYTIFPPYWEPTLIVDNSINADTLHEERNYARQKPANTYRIITMGNSLTFGLFINTSQNFSKQLEVELNTQANNCNTKFEVINLAVPGYAVRYMEERFKRLGFAYQPDLVIWLLVDSDFNHIEEQVYKGLSQNQEQVDVNNHKQLEDKYKQELAKATQTTTLEQAQNYQLASLADFGSLYQENLLFLTVNGVDYSASSDWLNKTLQNYAGGRPQTNFLQITDDLAKQQALFPDGHPNANGHLLIAGKLKQYLDDKGLTNCR